MLYAKVVVGLPVDGPFDYSVPSNFSKSIKEGMRAWIHFRAKRVLGYVVRLTKETSIQKVKPILDIIDDSPILDKNMLLFTRELSNYYGCSWGEAIEAALPQGVKKGRLLPAMGKLAILAPAPCVSVSKRVLLDMPSNEILLIHDWDRVCRWDIYVKEIKAVLAIHKSVIILLPDKKSVLKIKKIIETEFSCSVGVLYRQQSYELIEWANTREGKFDIILGTRSSVFAPVNNLGLIIVDEEQDTAYKQDQVPHYHAREAAFIRINIEKAKLILGSTLLSLESFYLAKKGFSNTLKVDDEHPLDSLGTIPEFAEGRSRTIKYISLPKKGDFPEVKIIDMRHTPHNFRQKNIILSKFLEDCILKTQEAKGKTLLFLNRKGFATIVSCRHCGVILKCPRCSINLVYHFQDNILNCHSCNYKMEAPKICPSCNSGYMRYMGAGTEKVESELARIFPQARVKMADNPKNLDMENTDIFISTKSIIKEAVYNFDLIGILSIDNSLNRIDFRSTEKTFCLLIGILSLTDKKVIIQTNLPKHYCLRAIENKDIHMFYEEELKERRQLKFPPFKHLAIVKLRGSNEERVKKISADLFNKLKKINKDKGINIVCVNPGQPEKLRGNFYWQILIKANSPFKIVKFLKLHLKSLPHSGIIITIDVDPL